MKRSALRQPAGPSRGRPFHYMIQASVSRAVRRSIRCFKETKLNAAPPSSLTNPLTTWAAFAATTAEMLTASTFVIGQRLARLCAAGAVPSARDRREFTLMGQEKLEAAAGSWQAMTRKLLVTSPRVALRTCEPVIAVMTAAAAFPTSQTPWQALALQAKAAGAIGEMAQSASRLTDAAVAVMQAGLEPIHAKAVANAKRLREPDQTANAARATR